MTNQALTEERTNLTANGTAARFFRCDRDSSGNITDSPQYILRLLDGRVFYSPNGRIFRPATFQPGNRMNVPALGLTGYFKDDGISLIYSVPGSYVSIFRPYPGLLSSDIIVLGMTAKEVEEALTPTFTAETVKASGTSPYIFLRDRTHRDGNWFSINGGTLFYRLHGLTGMDFSVPELGLTAVYNPGTRYHTIRVHGTTIASCNLIDEITDFDHTLARFIV